MCDYSLMNLPNRLAVEGEDLIVHRFPSGSMGLASPADLYPPQVEAANRHTFWGSVKAMFSLKKCTVPAVCIPPASRLRLHNTSERMQRDYGIHRDEDCTFDQLTADSHTHRDVVRFCNGKFIRIQQLPEGMGMTVLDMSVAREHHVSLSEMLAGVESERI
jgi:hypothetical protein